MRRTADVVVVGGGVIGCAVARELGRRGARVVVVERGRVGAEATRAAAGMVAPQAECERPGPVLHLGLASRALWPAWAAALEEESGVDVEYRRDGILYAALAPVELRVLAARARWQRAAGLRVERLGGRAARRLVPVLAPGVRAAFLFPDDHRVNNERLGAAVAGAARAAGARILEGTAVLAVLARRGRVAGVRTARGRIAAPTVVNAAGAWAPAATLPRGVPPPSVFPVRGQMMVLRAAPGLLPRALYSLAGYLVPREDGRILAGSTRERAGFERRVTAGGAAAVLAAACALAPAVGGLAFEGAWAGFRPGTPDGVPLLGPSGALPGLVYATGHYRNGILLAPATGVAVADLIVTGRTALPVAGMEPDRRARLRGGTRPRSARG
jgi:glycine oxidase